MELKKFLNTDNWFDYQNFYEFISKKNFKILVEVGSWKGHSISYLGKLLKNSDAEIYAVDLWDETYKYEDNINLKKQKKILHEIFKENLKKNGLEGRVKDIKSYSWEAAKNFSDSSVDFVFIDADHKYESVVKDINAWLPKIKKGGIISGHDYFNPCGVKKAVDENFGGRVKFNGSCWYVEL